MSVKIRLQRHGKKGKPFYHVVAADARAKRDGRFIEKIGTYNPNTNPATIEVKHDRALYWLGVGAQPTETARAILKYTGAIYHNHLLKGVANGALTEAEATKRFEDWYSEKQAKIDAKSKKIIIKINKKKLRPSNSEVRYLLCNPKKAKKLLNWKPSCNNKAKFIEKLKSTIKHYSENYRLYNVKFYD